MAERHPGSMWFPSDMDPSDQYRRQVSWVKVRAELEARRAATSIGWLWIQRRGWKKWPHARLRAALGDDIEIYRKPSVSTRYDITPPELVGWDAPVERKLSELNLRRADLGEKPLWDIWIRLTPPQDTTKAERARAEQHIRDKTAQDVFTERHESEVERRSHLHPLEIEIEDHANSPKWMLEKAQLDWDRFKRNRLVRLRHNHRMFAEKPQDRLDRLRAEAYAVHRARIEAGRQRVACATKKE